VRTIASLIRDARLLQGRSLQPALACFVRGATTGLIVRVTDAAAAIANTIRVNPLWRFADPGTAWVSLA